MEGSADAQVLKPALPADESRALLHSRNWPLTLDLATVAPGWSL